jgi:anti-sigma B factor antagonist
MAPADLPLLTTEIVSGPVPVVRVQGELDLATAPQLTDSLRTAASPAPARIVIDLERLKFCDSTGLRALIMAVREIEGRGGEATLLVAPDGQLERLLDLLGMRDVVRIAYSTPK